MTKAMKSLPDNDFTIYERSHHYELCHNTDQTPGKLRPALALRQCPSQYDDWLIFMVSSQLTQYISDVDEMVAEDDVDFMASGLKQTSII